MVDSPHVEVRDGDICQWDNVGTADHDGATRDAIVDCSGPVVECETAEGDGPRVRGGMRFPVLVDI